MFILVTLLFLDFIENLKMFTTKLTNGWPGLCLVAFTDLLIRMLLPSTIIHVGIFYTYTYIPPVKRRHKYLSHFYIAALPHDRILPVLYSWYTGDNLSPAAPLLSLRMLLSLNLLEGLWGRGGVRDFNDEDPSLSLLPWASFKEQPEFWVWRQYSGPWIMFSFPQ